MEIRALRENDDRSRFSCGEEHLDRFFRVYAGQNQFRHHIGVTYVAVEGEEIIGFATVAPSHIEIEVLPAAARKKLPSYPLPVLRLARLAVSRAYQSRGIGRQLIRFVMGLALEMDARYGCAALTVDSKPGAVEFYAGLGFITMNLLEGESDARPRPIPLYLSVQTLRRSAP
jgi:GNAT superfamily N-acetyltransferase